MGFLRLSSSIPPFSSLLLRASLMATDKNPRTPPLNCHSLMRSFLSTNKPSHNNKIVIRDEDLVSDESLWDLYDRWRRWMCHPSLGPLSRRPYSPSPERFNVFKETAIFIHNYNKLGESCTLGLNHFSDMSSEEFEATHLRGLIIEGTPFGSGDGDAVEGVNQIKQNGGITTGSNFRRRDGPCDASKTNEIDGHENDKMVLGQSRH